MSSIIEHNDKIAFYPGYYLQEFLENIGTSLNDFAEILGMSPEDISEILEGNKNVTSDIARKLSETFVTSESLWAKLFAADWKMHAKAAGPIRNKQIAEYADILIAFPFGESRGTANMIGHAKNMGLLVYIVDD